MEPIFQNSFRMTEGQNKEFFAESRKKLNYKGGRAVTSSLLPLAVLIAGAAITIFATTRDQFYLLLVFAGLLIGGVCIFFNSYFEVRDRQLFGRKDFIDINVGATFFADKFEWSVNKKTIAVPYEKVWGLIATEVMIILLFDKGSPVNAAAALSKFDFKLGAVKDFENFIRNKCPNLKKQSDSKKQDKLTK